MNARPPASIRPARRVALTPSRLTMALWLMVVLLILAMVGVEWDRHQRDVRQSEEVATSAVEAAVVRLAAEVDAQIRGLDAFVAQADEWGGLLKGTSAGDLDQRLVEGLRWQPLLRNLSLFDDHGAVLASANRLRVLQVPAQGLPSGAFRLLQTPDGRLWWVQASVNVQPGAVWVAEIGHEGLLGLLRRQRGLSDDWLALHNRWGEILASDPALSGGGTSVSSPGQLAEAKGPPRIVQDPRFASMVLLRSERVVVDGLVRVSVSRDLAAAREAHAIEHRQEWVRIGGFSLAIVLIAGVLHLQVRRMAHVIQRLDEQDVVVREAVAAQVAAEAAQQQTQDRLASFLERLPEGFWHVDLRQTTVDVNPALCRMLGFERAEMIGRSMAEFVAPDSRNALGAHMAPRPGQVLAENCEIGLIRKDGKRVDCILHRNPLLGERGEMLGYMTIWTDVTHIKAAQRAVSHYQSTLEQAINAMSDGLAVFDADENLQLWNERYFDLYPFMRGRLRVGMAQDEISDLVARELNPAATPVEIEAHKARRREQRRNAKGSAVFSMPYGIDVEILDRRVPDGRRVTVFRDVTASRRQAQQLSEANATIEQALDAMSDAFLVFDHEEKLLVWNRRYVEMFPMLAGPIRKGISQDEISTLTTRALNPDATEAEISMRMQRRRDQLQQASGTVAWRTQTGQAFELTDRRLADGKRVTVIRDVTAEREAERRLAGARDAAEAGARAKSRFLASMSHEIRTPLNAVLGMNGLLRDTPLNDEQRKFVDLIAKSGESLLAIINDILDLSRLEAGKMNLEVVDFSLEAAVNDVVSMLTTRAQAKGIALALNVDAAVRNWVLRGDPSRLRQVLFNLVGNAVKFTDTGSVKVQVMPRVVDGAGAGPYHAAFAIEVIDTGIGIAPGALPHLFEHFSQGDSSTSRRFGGTGLGLAITKEIVELMGGQVRVQSEPGRGSTFTVELTLPVAAPATPNAAAEAATSTLGGGSPVEGSPALSILVAEDNSFNQLLIRTMLTKMGHQVHIVGDGAEALRQVQALAYDVVLMDMQMPGMDGLDATRAIRAIGGPVGSVPIVALTANVMTEDRAACTDAGMDDFLAKPINPDALRAALERAVQGRLVA